MNRPLVSMLMITGKPPGRPLLARQAIHSCCLQSWSNKELVIVNDGGIPVWNGTEPIGCRVREVMVPRQPSLGDLRNISLCEARGDWWLQVDDDDWHHPDRLSLQMQRARPGCAVVLTHQVRYSFVQDSAFVWVNMQDGIAGTVLAPADGRRYLPKPRNEDTVFLQQHFPGERLIRLNNAHQPELYIRTFSGHNTWDEGHIMKGLAGRLGEWQLPKGTASYVRHVLTHYQEYRGA